MWFGAYSYLLLSAAPTCAHIYKWLENGSMSVSQKTFLFIFSTQDEEYKLMTLLQYHMQAKQSHCLKQSLHFE